MIILLLSSLAVAQTVATEPSAFEKSLMASSVYKTEERWIEVDGTRFREVEINGEKFYFKMTGAQGEFSDLDCTVPSQSNPNLLSSEVEIFHRSRAFICPGILPARCSRSGAKSGSPGSSTGNHVSGLSPRRFEKENPILHANVAELLRRMVERTVNKVNSVVAQKRRTLGQIQIMRV